MFQPSWSLVVLMEDLVDDLPLAIDFKQSEQVGEPNAGPVVEFKPNSGDRFDKVDAGDLRLEVWCWTVLVIPVKQLLNRAGKQFRAVMTEDRRILVEGGLHVVASAGSGAIDVQLDDLGDRIIFTHVRRHASHESYSLGGGGGLSVWEIPSAVDQVARRSYQ
jgi:hypothetical protein